ncbi:MULTISPECIES: hypothetical protein [Methanosarcina]|uniref:NADPH-dependent FMN reductase n=1 Tax=Methanosarcina barkeri CM1 TaxID=796385 RepID=A0A0G3C6M9_METBA|nr:MULTISPECIES: hypothetical protein [Methanosarcina]AKJ37636.1 hypothetical protein MCM1_0537 [Methanosarcina barkeri CM1]
MKIVGIQSSPRGKHRNTLKLLNTTLDGASEEGAEVGQLILPKRRSNTTLHAIPVMKLGCAQ